MLSNAILASPGWMQYICWWDVLLEDSDGGHRPMSSNLRELREPHAKPADNSCPWHWEFLCPLMVLTPEATQLLRSVMPEGESLCEGCTACWSVGSGVSGPWRWRVSTSPAGLKGLESLVWENRGLCSRKMGVSVYTCWPAAHSPKSWVYLNLLPTFSWIVWWFFLLKGMKKGAYFLKNHQNMIASLEETGENIWQ